MEGINQVTERIIRAYFAVYNVLGYGFLEKVYENAMIIELKKIGLHGRRQVPIKVYYESERIGLNFGKKPGIKRKVFENKYKKSVPIC